MDSENIGNEEPIKIIRIIYRLGKKFQYAIKIITNTNKNYLLIFITKGLVSEKLM